MFNWIEKKDLSYWFIIATMFSLLSSDIGRFESFALDNWTFAGTIVSIILAVIAILYTFDQSSTTVASTKKLEESADRVENATKDLESHSLKVIIEDLESRLSAVLNEMEQGINENIENSFEPLKIFMHSKGKGVPIDEDIQILSDENWREYLNNSIVKSITIEGITLLYSYFLYENELKYSSRKTKAWLSSVSKEAARDNSAAGIIIGQIRLFSTLNVYSYEESGEFTYYNESLHLQIKNIVDKKQGRCNSLMKSLEGFFDIEE